MFTRLTGRSNVALLAAGVAGHTLLAALVLRGLSAGAPLVLSLALLVVPVVAVAAAGVELVRRFRETATADRVALSQRRS